MKTRKLLCAALLTLPLLAHAQPGAGQRTDAGQRVQDFLAADERSEADREADGYRRPVQTLEFFGLEPGMTVLEYMPGGGYYSEILAHGIGDDGTLYLVGGGAEPTTARLRESGRENVTALSDDDVSMTPSGQPGWFDMQHFAPSVEAADMFLTFRNLHNITQETRHLFHAGAFDALAPGGIYGIIDHTRRHNDPGGPEIWRRVDPVQVIKEVLDAGFEFVDYSNLHYRADDPLLHDTLRPSINRNSDRFTLKFRKPL